MATKTITIEPIQIERIIVELEGITPLIVHKFSQKMQDAMMAKMTKQLASGREERDPQREAEECLYLCEDGQPGFPASGFKKAMTDAVSQVKGTITKVLVRQAVHIETDDPRGLVPISGEWEVFSATVRLPNGSSDIRFRPMFKTGWKCQLRIAFNSRAISAKQIVSLLQHAGFGVGIGDWRPEKNGTYGRFRIVSDDD